MRRVTLALTLVAALACGRAMDRAQWQAMSPAQKTLYVRSLLGHEQAKAAKGGNDRVFDAPPETYVQQIDAAYAHGDARKVDDVFESLGRRR